MKNKQMKAKAFVYALALLSSVASAKDQFACDNHFGENIQIVTEKRFDVDRKTRGDFREGDFNGDGLRDRVIMLRLNKTSQFYDGITLLRSSATELNGYESNGKQSTDQVDVGEVSYLTKDTMALGIIQSNVSDKKCRKFVIYNTGYFSPANEKSLAVSIIYAANPDSLYTDLQKYVLGDLRHDAIYLYASDLAIVYWSKGKYMFEVTPHEFPDDEE
jgi:hypothetical protein